jgi:subfamily B ATP-binding cassette protein MsbA
MKAWLPKNSPSSGAWQEARALVWAHRARLSLGLALLLVNRLSGLVLPSTSKWLIDDVVGKSHWDLLWLLAAAAAVATVIEAGTSFLLSQVLGVAAQRAITDLRMDIQAHVVRLPVRYFDTTKSGALIARVMNDPEGIRSLVGSGLVQFTGSILTAAMAAGILCYLNAPLTLVTLLILALFGAVSTLGFRRLRPMFRERWKVNAEVSGRLGESIGGIRVVKAYVMEPHESRVFASGVQHLFGLVRKTVTGSAIVSAFSTLILGTIGITMLLVGGASIRAGTMTVGDFVMYLMFTGLIAGPASQFASLGAQWMEAFAGLDRIREIRRMKAEDDAEERAQQHAEGDRHETVVPVPSIAGDVTFEDVTFEYTVGTPVLSRVTFHAASGTTTALVGSSGSGKSTLVSLVMAFNRPNAGRVLVDGRDLANLPLRDYRRHLGVVLQDNFLFDGTIAENIAYARPDAGLDAIRAAARIAHCDEFIDRFERQYDTIVGERGVRLSGGQRQRVAIARAILADPRILILDEATSSLDSESEAFIQDGLRSLRHGRTTFVIAHRLSTIRSADQILVLEGGEIVERGRHEDLLARGGRYRQLYDRQYHFERERFINPGEEYASRLAGVAPATRITPLSGRS